MSSPSAVSPQTRSSRFAAIVLLALFMATALVAWQLLPRPQSHSALLVPAAAALVAGRLGGGAAVLSVRSSLVAGSAYLLCQLTMQVLLLVKIISV